MATVFFGRTDEQFWDMTPRLLVAMIGQWNDINKAQAKMAGIVNAAYRNGKNPDDYLIGKKPEKVKKLNRDQLEHNARLVF